MMFKMTATAPRPGDETERQFGWQDMFVGPDADPRGIGGIFVHHGDERTVLAGYLHDYRLTLELKCAGLDADAMARRSVEPSDLSLLGLVRHLSDAERYWFRGHVMIRLLRHSIIESALSSRRFRRASLVLGRLIFVEWSASLPVPSVRSCPLDISIS